MKKEESGLNRRQFLTLVCASGVTLTVFDLVNGQVLTGRELRVEIPAIVPGEKVPIDQTTGFVTVHWVILRQRTFGNVLSLNFTFEEAPDRRRFIDLTVSLRDVTGQVFKTISLRRIQDPRTQPQVMKISGPKVIERSSSNYEDFRLTEAEVEQVRSLELLFRETRR